MDTVPSNWSAGQDAARPAAKIVLWHVVLGILVSAIAFAVFLLVAICVVHDAHGAVRFDRAILLWMHAHQRPGWTELARFLALLGSPTVIVGVAVCATIAGAVDRRVRGAAWTFPLAVAGAGIIIESIKLFVHRARPDLFRPLLHETGYSFPSGHSLISIVVYGLAGYFASHFVKTEGARVLTWVATAALVLMVGLSRVYVGVHYPTDVIAGWSMGVPWLVCCLGLHEVMVRRFGSVGEPVLSKPPAASRALARRLTVK